MKNRRIWRVFACAILAIGLTGCGQSMVSPSPTETTQPLSEACTIVGDTLAGLDRYVSAAVSSITVGDLGTASEDMSTAAGLVYSAKAQVTRDDVTKYLDDLQAHIHSVGELISGMREKTPTTLDGWEKARTTIDDAVAGVNEAGADIDELCAPH